MENTNPQLENGYTRIANEILEAVAKLPLSAAQFRILMLIWRYSYGYNRKDCALSVSFIAAATGIDKRQVRREINELVQMNIINIESEATFSSPRVLTFNKHYDTWQVASHPAKDILSVDKYIHQCKECSKHQCETQEDTERQIQLNRLRQYSMMDARFTDCRFENFQLDDKNEKLYRLAVNYCNRWQKMKQKNMGFLFYGPPGTGKSYLAFCIANRLLDELVPVIAISTIGLLNRIKQTYNSYGKEAEIEIINMLKNASLLILDDIGAENDTPWVKEKLYEIIDSRYRDEKPLICTTNLTKEQLRDKLTGDDGVYRTYDRLIEMCYPIEITGPSRRIKAALDKAEIIEELLNS